MDCEHEDSLNADQSDHLELKKKSLRGGLITFFCQLVAIGVQLTSIIVMARLLSPFDYGILAMITSITSFASMFRDLGLSSAIIQQKEISNAEQSNVFWLTVLVGLSLTVVIGASSGWVAWFYSREELRLVTAVMSFNFVLASMGSQSQACLTRNMQFGRIAIATTIGNLANLALTISLGLAGLAYWSIVFGNLLAAIITSLTLLGLSSFRPSVPQYGASVRKFLSFGVDVTVFDFLNYFQRNLDNILIGYNYGANVLGLYNRAYSLLMFPIQSIRGPVNSVAFPAMSKLQDSPTQLRDYFLQTVEIIALLTMPLAAVLSISAKSFIHLALGPDWEEAASIFSILALVALVQPTSGFVGSLLLSLGKSKTYLWCGIFNTSVICIGFLIGIRWGAYGIAVSYAITNYLVLFPWISRALRDTPVNIRQFVSACLFPLLLTLVCSASALMTKQLLASNDYMIQLVSISAASACGGVCLMLLTQKGRGYISMVLAMFRQRRPMQKNLVIQ